jgi:hypothetical protein
VLFSSAPEGVYDLKENILTIDGSFYAVCAQGERILYRIAMPGDSEHFEQAVGTGM